MVGCGDGGVRRDATATSNAAYLPGKLVRVGLFPGIVSLSYLDGAVASQEIQGLNCKELLPLTFVNTKLA